MLQFELFDLLASRETARLAQPFSAELEFTATVTKLKGAKTTQTQTRGKDGN